MLKVYFHMIRLIGIGVCVLLLAVCVCSRSEAEDASKPRQTDEYAAVQKSESEPYLYDSKGKLDPFRPFIEALASKQEQRPQIPLTPLQKFDITQLKLVGVIEGEKETKALIQDSSGKGYIIGLGTLIGPNWGRVVEIKPTQLVVQEKYKDPLGRIKSRKIYMKLHAAGERQEG